MRVLKVMDVITNGGFLVIQGVLEGTGIIAAGYRLGGWKLGEVIF
jgi:hypothetical protein